MLKLLGESFRTMKDGVKEELRLRFVYEKVMVRGEKPHISRPISFQGREFRVIKFRKGFSPKSPATGFLVLENDKPVDDIDICKNVLRVYNIWYLMYISPFARYNKRVFETFMKFNIDSVNEMQKRAEEGYPNHEEIKKRRLIEILKELDKQVLDHHPHLVQYNESMKKLDSILFDVFEFPSDDNIRQVMEIAAKIRDEIPLMKEIMQRRVAIWDDYLDSLKDVYGIELKTTKEASLFKLVKSSLSDVMKIAFEGEPIPNRTIGTATIEVSKVLFDHLTGTECLKSVINQYDVLDSNIRKYESAWKDSIGTHLIRNRKSSDM